MKNRGLNAGWLILVFVVGLSLLLYPSVSNYVNELNGSRAISEYSDAVSNLKAEEYARMMEDARAYNRSLNSRVNIYTLEDEQRLSYQNLLNVDGRGIMGYIEIPSINVSLPIYHGTDDTVLQRAVGHLDWTSLPVGGESTHSVISGHRGLPSAKLFTNLDKLVEGDVFMIRVLNEVLTYEVDQILTVLPENTSALQIEAGKDYCTLVTCTPYGINSHRLLVRGHRIENTEKAKTVHVVAEAMQIEPLVIATVVGIPVLVLIMIIVFIHSGKKRESQKPGREEK